ncbi:LamG-like jellyroll fold domain-containing protein [Streptomyces sp. H39-C1]|uniref:LamG-like jellyroll fold domain-containing protein n=1 Tax=Streptomyces sp. H39-C1 TaxID=3004355 RepID=UPI0022B04CEE|nr:LamG-like jellyroll fold domain-containing protein [Streptomyces sp. H39-C1]MCZ4102531.1 DNA/RNA non-specific endonuclease [Streptomyces sp. H39-C1]
MSSAAAPTTWLFPMSLTGLSLVTATDGTIELVDGSSTVVATLPKAYAYDASVDPVSGERHENWAMDYSVTTVNGTPAVRMSLDPAWLQGSDIKFPVTVDPTVALSTAGQTDTTYAEYPYSEDFSSSSVMKIGTYDAGAHIAESLIKIPSLPTSNGYHITGAQFGVFNIWASTCGTSTSYHVYPISSSWSVTGSKSWSSLPSTAAAIGTWTGTPPSSVCSNTSLSSSTGQWQYTTLSTSYFQNIALGKTPNYGLALFSSGTDSQGWKQFDSSQVSSHAPYINITYAPNVAPDIKHTYPASGYASPTLTPELQVQGVDTDAWPNAALSYNFAVYNSSGTQVVSSGYQASPNWAVVAGKLNWSASYYWTVSAFDGWSTKTSSTQAFSTTVSQPLIASRLAQNSGHGFDELAGNFTTSTTDATVATVGPALQVDRAYNSLDVRTSGAFGAGWSSLTDMKAVMDDDGTKNVVITDKGGKEQRYGYSASGYTPPMGTYATMVALTGGGYTLTDTSGTTYTFGAAGGTNIWLLSKITTHAGLAETLNYNAAHQLTQIQNASSRRALHYTWATPSGAAHAHVATVATDAATYQDPTSAALWTYRYTGDQLTSVCPPALSASSTASSSCSGYSYVAGSNYPAAALDADPHSYWRLNEAAGSTTAASSVLANEQTDASTYNAVTLGSASSPLTGSTATAATFNGSSSYVRLPQSLVTGQTYLSISLWFKTSVDGGLLFTEQNTALGTSPAPSQATSSLYVGTDGKLHGGFYYGAIQGITSTAKVDNNTWHHAVLSAAGTTQTLYLDGTAQGSVSGAILNLAQSYAYLGAGYSTGLWPGLPAAGTRYFNGSIADVSLYDRQLTATQVAGLRTTGTAPAALLTASTLPSGDTKESVSYDTAAERLISVTDQDGGLYTLGSPTVAGSSAVFHSAVLGADPVAYWQLGDESGATDAANEVNGGDGTYNNATLGDPGPFASMDSTAPTAATFNGTDSHVLLPQDLGSATAATAELWFKTSKGGGILLAAQSDTLDNGTTAAIRTPQLWVGTDGKLHGGFWSNSGSTQLGSTAAVTDGKWHHAVLAAGATSQALYLDGVQAASATAAKALSLGGASDVYLGAGTTGTGWTGLPANVNAYFTGSIAEVALYPRQLSAAQVTTQWSAYKASSGTVATETVNVTDPAQRNLSTTYDLSAGGRTLSSTDGTGASTSYGYDTGGFLYTVTDPNGNVTTTGHDVRGNVVSRTTCQDRSEAKCSTSYYTYSLNGSSVTDPRNDEMLTSSDGRSANSTTTTYRTSYTYDTNGNKLTETTPAVTGHSAGLTTTSTYTTASTSGYVPGTTAPAGLLQSTTTPGGAATSYQYYDNGDLAVVVSPLGQDITFTYDEVGRPRTKTIGGTPYVPVIHYTYDPLGRVLTTTDPGVTDHINATTVHTKLTSYLYDVDGNTLSTTVSDTTGGDTSRVMKNDYNDRGQLERTTDPMDKQTQNTYDAYGNLSTKTMPRGQHYSYTYDANGRLLTTTLDNYTGSSATASTAAPQLVEKRTYQPNGRLDTVTNAIGVTRTYAYYDNGLTQQITDTGSSGTTYINEQDTYDAAGNRISQVTRNGALTTQHIVDAANRTTAANVDPLGANQVTYYSYDADSHALTSNTTDGAGNPAQQWTYTYDLVGNKLSAAQYVNPTTTLTTTWHYDARGQADQMTDPLQNTTRYIHDEVGQLAETVAPSVTTTSPTDGSTTTVTPITLVGYNTFGERTETQDARGNITVTAYDANGRKSAATLPSYTPAGSTSAVHATTAWTWDADGNLIQQVDAAGNATDYVYDQLADRVSQTNPAINAAGTMTRGTYTYSFDLAGNQLTQDTPYGSLTHQSYDDLGRAKSTWQYVYLNPSTTTKVQNTTSYNPAGDIASTASISGVTASFTYDHFGQKTSAADTTNDTTRYTYDLHGDITKTVLPDGSIQTATYDAAGRKTATDDKDNNGTVLRSTSATYDADGNLKSTKNALQSTVTYNYDALGELLSQDELVTADHTITTRYGYDAAGNKTAYTNGKGSTTYYTYTPWGLPETKQVPATTAYTSTSDRTTIQVYDALGHNVSTTLPGGITLTNAYDALGDLTQQAGASADAPTATRTFQYSLNQNLVSASVGSTQETYNSNALGQLLGASGQAGSSSFTYNPDGDLLTRVDASGTSSYQYDSNGRLATDTDAATGTTLTYGYNSLSQPTSIAMGTGANSRAFGYDALHRPTSDSLVGPTGTTIASIAYGYDNGDQLIDKTTTGFNGASHSTYGYDQAGRLTSWINTPTSTGTAAETRYSYDDDGNRLTAGTTSYTYDARDELISDGANSYSYSARGTLSGKTVISTSSTTATTFDAYGQQATAGATGYTYDALGRVITSGNTTLTYSGQDNIVASDGTSTYSRGPDGSVTGQNRTGTGATLTWSDAHTDVVGQFTATSTALTGSTAYDPWGTAASPSTLAGTLGYQGEYTDPTTGQVNMHARWYTPASGRFQSADTQENSAVGASANANPYAYGVGSPLTGTDPTGHDWDWIGIAKDMATRSPYGLAWDVFWGVSSPTALGDDSCEAFYGTDCTTAFAPVDNIGYGDHRWSRQTSPAYTSTHHEGRYSYPSARRTGGGNDYGSGHGGGYDAAAEARKAAARAAARAAAILANAVKLTAGIGTAALAVDSVAVVGAAPGAVIGVGAIGTGVKNAAFAISAGITTAAVCMIAGCDLPKNSLNQNCTIAGAGWTIYQGTDSSNGNRAQGVLACLTSQYLDTHEGSSTNSEIRPPGYAWAQRYARFLRAIPRTVVNNCHLLGSQLSGSGTNLKNLATCGRDANAYPERGGLGAMDNMLQFEERVATMIRGGETVLYSVRPVYDGNRVVPEGFAMSAKIWDNAGNSRTVNRYVPNLMNTPGGWKNLGTVRDPRTGDDVPTR